MKKIIYYLNIALLAFTAVACQKNAPATVDFDVTVAQSEVNAGDTVQFNFQGSADLVSVYSGEPGKEYQNRNRFEADGLKLQLTIASRVLYGSQANNLKLLCSTRFPGVYSAAGINDNDWNDITNEFTWSTAAIPNGIAATTTTSGPVDLTRFIESGKPVYFGYRYESQATTSAAQGGRSWRLPTFQLETVAPDGSKSAIATVRTAGWTIVPIVTGVQKASYWSITSADPYLQFVPNSTLEPHLQWVVSAPFLPTSVSPDKATSVKILTDAMPSSYKYPFAKAGTYKVTFVAKNVNGHGEENLVKELEIVVK